jgi:hypothetical protein
VCGVQVSERLLLAEPGQLVVHGLRREPDDAASRGDRAGGLCMPARVQASAERLEAPQLDVGPGFVGTLPGGN